MINLLQYLDIKLKYMGAIKYLVLLRFVIYYLLYFIIISRAAYT